MLRYCASACREYPYDSVAYWISSLLHRWGRPKDMIKGDPAMIKNVNPYSIKQASESYGTCWFCCRWRDLVTSVLQTRSPQPVGLKWCRILNTVLRQSATWTYLAHYQDPSCLGRTLTWPRVKMWSVREKNEVEQKSFENGIFRKIRWIWWKKTLFGVRSLAHHFFMESHCLDGHHPPWLSRRFSTKSGGKLDISWSLAADKADPWMNN